MIVIPRLRVNDTENIKRWEEHLQQQKSRIMAEAARKVAEIDSDFSRLLALSEQYGQALGPPPSSSPDGEEMT